MIARSAINKTQLGPLWPTQKYRDWSLKNDFPRSVDLPRFKGSVACLFYTGNHITVTSNECHCVNG